MKPTTAITVARVLVAVVLLSNLLCVAQFLFTPEAHTAAYQLQGPSSRVIVQSFAICFLMWNATYPPVIARPNRYRVLFGVVIVQQLIGLVGESILLASLAPGLETLAGSIVRFIVFDAAGLVLLLVAFFLSRKQA